MNSTSATTPTTSATVKPAIRSVATTTIEAADETGIILDALVAEHVMGWTQWVDLSEDCPNEPGVTYFAVWGTDGVAVYGADDPTGDPTFHFSPSSTITDAWIVVETMFAKDFWFTLNYLCGVLEKSEQPAWFARFRCVKAGTRGDHWAATDYAPLSICRAALAAAKGESK